MRNLTDLNRGSELAVRPISNTTCSAAVLESAGGPDASQADSDCASKASGPLPGRPLEH